MPKGIPLEVEIVPSALEEELAEEEKEKEAQAERLARIKEEQRQEKLR